jgi:hypothetical protein
MNTFDLNKYLAEGGIEENLLLAELETKLDSIIQEYKNETIEELPLTEEEKQQLNEENLPALIIGGILSAPKVISLLGKTIQKIVTLFKKIKAKIMGKDMPEEESVNALSKWLESKSHTLHDKYIKFFKWVVKTFGIAKPMWTDDAGKIEEDKLKMTAEVLLFLSIATAAYFSVTGSIAAASSGHPIMAALEGGLSTIKGAELSQIIQKVGPKLIATL